MDNVDLIYEMEHQNPTRFEHERRYLGVASEADRCPRLLLNTIQAATFFQHSYRDAVLYLYEYSLMKPSLPPRILQLLVLEDDTYVVCDKTFWLRIVQRAWKRVFRQRREMKFSRSLVERELGRLRRVNVPHWQIPRTKPD